MTARDVPAGWYDDGHGGQRWFDGTEWTENVMPGATEPAPERRFRPPPPYVPPAGDRTSDDDAPARADAGTGNGPDESGDPDRQDRRRRRVVAGLGVVVVTACTVVGYLVVTNGDEPAGPARSGPAANGSGTNGSGTNGSGTTATASAAGSPIDTGEWRVESYRFTRAADGTLTGSADVTFTGSQADDGQAALSLTVRSPNGEATAYATALAAEPGSTTTVELVSTDRYVDGPYATISARQDF